MIPLIVLDSLAPWAIALIVVGAIIGLVLLVAIIIVIWWITTLNNMRRMVVKIDEAESGIDVALEKRFDLLTKTFNTVKGYAKHESETLEKVIAMRSPSKGASMKEKAEFASSMNKAFDSINIVMEQYPNLKANENFLKLQNQITDVEEHLQAARRVYNSNVSSYNQYIVVFPSNIVAKRHNMTSREFFEVEEGKRQDVKIEF